VATKIYDYLTKDLYVAQESGVASVVSSGVETPSESFTSGEVDGDLTFIGGFIESKGFESGVAGWRLTAEGNLEAVNATLSGTITATSGQIGGTTITSTALTGGIIQTAATGTRIVLEGATNELRFYNNSTRLGAIEPDVSGSIFALDINLYRTASGPHAAMELRTNETGGSEESSIHFRVGTSVDGFDIDYLDSDGFATFDFNGRVASSFSPDTDATRDLGTSSSKWDDLWVDEVHYNTLTAISDARLKHSVNDLPWGLTSYIDKLRPVSFVRNGKFEREWGFIAQEVKSEIGELVRPFDLGGEEFYSIDQGALLTLAVRAIQELSSRVRSLEEASG